MSKKLLIVGAGGHAKSVLDILLENNKYEWIGVIDNDYGTKKYVAPFADIEIVGNDAMLTEFFEKGITNIFVAIGSNAIRKKLYNISKTIGFEAVSIISSHATISKYAKIGKGVCIMPGAVINVATTIGDHCIINTNCTIDHDCTIQECVHIAPGVAISGCVTIGRNSFIGTGARVIDRVTIGANTTIGSGAAVINHIPSHVLAVGVPAKVIKNKENMI